MLFYLVIAAVIGMVVFFLAVFVFGRGEQMAALDPRTSPAELPDQDITSEDVRKIRFALALRGYRMSDVDWTLERLGDQLDALRRENAQLLGESSLDGQEPDEGHRTGGDQIDAQLGSAIETVVPDERVSALAAARSQDPRESGGSE